MRTQDYHQKLLTALNENHGDILGDQPIRVIPTGDVMLEVHRRLKAGKLVDAEGKPFVLTRRTVIVDNEEDRNFDPVGGKLLWSVPLTASHGMAIAAPRKLGL